MILGDDLDVSTTHMSHPVMACSATLIYTVRIGYTLSPDITAAFQSILNASFIFWFYPASHIVFNTALLPVSAHQSYAHDQCYCPVMFLFFFFTTRIYALKKLAIKYLKLIMKESEAHLTSVNQLQDFAASGSGYLLTLFHYILTIGDLFLLELGCQSRLFQDFIWRDNPLWSE